MSIVEDTTILQAALPDHQPSGIKPGSVREIPPDEDEQDAERWDGQS